MKNVLFWNARDENVGVAGGNFINAIAICFFYESIRDVCAISLFERFSIAPLVLFFNETVTLVCLLPLCTK